jgi:hypothetical protein
MNACDHGKIYVIIIVSLVILAILIKIIKITSEESKKTTDYKNTSIAFAVLMSLCLSYLLYLDSSLSCKGQLGPSCKYSFAGLLTGIMVLSSSIFLVVYGVEGSGNDYSGNDYSGNDYSGNDYSDSTFATVIGSVGLMIVASGIISVLLCRLGSR